MGAQEKYFRKLDAMEAEHREMERSAKASKRKAKRKSKRVRLSANAEVTDAQRSV